MKAHHQCMVGTNGKVNNGGVTIKHVKEYKGSEHAFNIDLYDASYFIFEVDEARNVYHLRVMCPHVKAPEQCHQIRISKYDKCRCDGQSVG